MKDRTKLKAKEILYFLGCTAGIGLAMSNPHFMPSLLSGLAKNFEREEQDRELYLRLFYLRRRKLIRMRRVGDEVKIILTDEGKRRVLLGNIENLAVKKQERWDDTWRLVFADIPERKRSARDSFRDKLKDIGFETLNFSAWIYPYESEHEIDLLAAFLGIEQYVHYLTATKISNDGVLRNKFGLQKKSP